MQKRSLNEIIKAVVDALKLVPLSCWQLVVEKEPEYREMKSIAQWYPPGPFLVLMLAAGLNDFQLKGRAEIAYWPPLRKHLENSPVPNSLDELELILEQFYQNERLNYLKIRRLKRFLRSSLAKKLWNMVPKAASGQLKSIWLQVAAVMRQKPSDKTIAFSAKTLGIGLLLLNETGFDFTGIPLPIDLRVRSLTPFLKTDDQIQRFWNQVLKELQTEQPNLTHLHLDSLLWQYCGAMNKLSYLMNLGISEESSERIRQTFEALKTFKI